MSAHRLTPSVFLIALLSACPAPERSSPPVASPSASDTLSNPQELRPTAPTSLRDQALPRSRPAQIEVHSKKAAIEAVSSGQAESALIFLQKHLHSLKNTHEDPDAVLALALAQAHLGHVHAAQATLHSLLTVSHTPELKSRVLRQLARLAFSQGESKQADDFLSEALQIDPNPLANKGARLASLHRRGQRQSPQASHLIDALYDAFAGSKAKTGAELLAVARATLATQTHGGYQDANLVLSEAEALESTQQDLPLFNDILLLHAAIFRKKYAIDEAEAVLQILFQHDPFHPDALVLWGHLQLDRLQLSDASLRAEEALLTNPTHPGAHALLARVALIEGRQQQAKSIVEASVLTVNPSHHEGLMVLATLALFQHDNASYTHIRELALFNNPSNADFFLQLADTLNFLHLYPESDQVLREAIATIGEHDPFLQSAYGLNALRLGQEQAGRDAIERAWRGDRANQRTFHTRKLYQERIDSSYQEHTQRDLILRLPTRDQEWVREGFQAAIARARRALDQAYGIRPSPLRIEIFDRKDDFSIRTVGIPSLGALGVCFGKVITILGPYQKAINFDQVIWHEIAHSYAIELSEGRVPRWFTEGLSEWESELANPAWARESAALLLHAQSQKKLRKLHELELAFLHAQDPIMMEIAYASSAYALRYLGETFGRARIIAMLKGYRQGKTSAELFIEVYNKDMTTMEMDFELWLNQELRKEIHGWTPSTHSPLSASSDPLDLLFSKALHAMEDKDLTLAARLLTTLIQKGGDGYPSRLLLAKALLSGPNRSQAGPHLEQAAQFNKQANEPLALMARLAFENQDLTLEKEILERALRIDAMALDPAARLFMLALLSHDTPRMKLALTRLRALSPLHPMTLAARAEALLTRGNGKKKDRVLASALLDKSESRLHSGQGPGDTWVVAALAAHALHEPKRAQALAKRALQGERLPSLATKTMNKLLSP